MPVGSLALATWCFGLLLLTINWHGIWADEFHTFDAVELAPDELVFQRASAGHPPLFFLLEKISVLAFGKTVLGFRLISVTSISLAAAVAYQLCLRLSGNRRNALALAVCSVFCPGLLSVAQLSRSYSIIALCNLLLLYLVSTPDNSGTGFTSRPTGIRCREIQTGVGQLASRLAPCLHYFTKLLALKYWPRITFHNHISSHMPAQEYWRGAEKGAERKSATYFGTNLRLICIAVTTCCGLYTHQSALLVIGGLLVAIWMTRPSGWRSASFGILLGVISFLPFWLTLLSERPDRHVNWISNFQTLDIFNFIPNLLLGTYAWRISPFLLLPLSALAMSIVLFATKGSSLERLIAIQCLMCWAFAVVLCLPGILVISIPRYFAFLAVPTGMLLGWHLIVRLRPEQWMEPYLVFIISAGIYLGSAPFRPDCRALANHLDLHAKVSDGVYVLDHSSIQWKALFLYYDRPVCFASTPIHREFTKLHVIRYQQKGACDRVSMDLSSYGYALEQQHSVGGCIVEVWRPREKHRRTN